MFIYYLLSNKDQRRFLIILIITNIKYSEPFKLYVYIETKLIGVLI